MKRLLLLLLFSQLVAMEDPRETQIKSLQELAAKKVAETINIESEQFKELPLLIQVQLLVRKGSLDQFIDFIQLNPTSDEKDILIKLIPDKLYEAFINETISLQDFVNIFSNLDKLVQNKIENAIRSKIVQYYNYLAAQDSLPVFEIFQEKTFFGFTTGGWVMIGSLPVTASGVTYVSKLTNITMRLLPVKPELNYSISLFILQKIQHDVLKHLQKIVQQLGSDTINLTDPDDLLKKLSQASVHLKKFYKKSEDELGLMIYRLNREMTSIVSTSAIIHFIELPAANIKFEHHKK